MRLLMLVLFSVTIFLFQQTTFCFSNETFCFRNKVFVSETKFLFWKQSCFGSKQTASLKFSNKQVYLDKIKSLGCR